MKSLSSSSLPQSRISRAFWVKTGLILWDGPSVRVQRAAEACLATYLFLMKSSRQVRLQVTLEVLTRRVLDMPPGFPISYFYLTLCPNTKSLRPFPAAKLNRCIRKNQWTGDPVLRCTVHHVLPASGTPNHRKTTRLRWNMQYGPRAVRASTYIVHYRHCQRNSSTYIVSRHSSA